jgi:excisionase family DNA binding protein
VNVPSTPHGPIRATLNVPDGLVDQLAAAVAAQLDGSAADRWMTTREAAPYLGLSVPALHRLTAARAVPFEQSSANARCWFKRSELDEWRRSGQG